ncbi:MAG: DUF799 family lipoprotein [Syntrophales bacterium]|nr:DUF799 family lipoprotein [Syntrophales bacterium]
MVQRYILKLIFATVCLLTLITYGCVVATKETVISPEIKSFFLGTYKVYPYMEKHMPKTVAVLPFVDVSQSQQGATAVRKGFYNHFSSLPFKDMELKQVDNLLEKAGLTDPIEINKKTPQELGAILGVDAVIYGEISNFDKLFAVMYSQVAVGAKIKMYDTKSGELLWTGEHTVRLHEGGISLNPIGIAATIVATAMNVRDIQLLRACDDLFRDMVKTIPTPSIADALRPPEITLLVQDTKNIPKKAGDEIRVVIQGTPKKQAWFDIGDYKKHIEMYEQPDTPGVYLGVYRVVPGDNVRKAVITGYLRDEAGGTAQWVDAIGTVTLKTTPPEKPPYLKTVGRNGTVLLNWGASKDLELVGYKIYRSLTPITGYQEIAKTETTEHKDTGLTNGTRYYYAVTAIDAAGNESEKTIGIGTPVAPGPTLVKDNIEDNATWFAGASPYILEGNVKIMDKASLTVEPGTEIHAKGGSLIVEGSLIAEGDGEHIITWDTAETGTRWGGIVFRNTKDKTNILRFNRIRNAHHGVKCLSSSPVINESEFTENDTAIFITGAFSSPMITKNVIQKNRGTGITITDGAHPTVQHNTIKENEKEGIYIKGAAPTLSGNKIVGNKGTGITVYESQASVQENNIYDNEPLNMLTSMTGDPVNAINNWWGTKDVLAILNNLKGRIRIDSVLDAPYPKGKQINIPILPSKLEGTIKSDGFLILSNSPYLVTGNVTVDGGATIYIEPGVVIKYDQRAAIIIEDGAIHAKGQPDRPIVFTAAATSPAPGFYSAAARFTKKTKLSSYFAYCDVQYAETAFDIHFGELEITNCFIANNGQTGIYCRNDAAPRSPTTR